MSLICLCLLVVGIQVELDAVDVYLALPASVFPVRLQDQAVHQEIICIQRLRVRLLCDLGGWTREAREAFLMRWWLQREDRLRKLRPRHFPQGLCELWPAQAPVGLHTLNCAGSQNPGFGWLGNTQEAPVSTPPKEFHPSMRCRRMSLSLQSCDPHVCRSYAEGVGDAGGFQFPSGPGSRNRSRAGIGVCWTCRAVSGQCMQPEFL